LGAVLGWNSVACGGLNGAVMGDPTGEPDKGALRPDFDRRVLLQFRGSTITSAGGLLAYRELDDALGLTDTGADARTGKNGRHRLAGLLRQSVFGRLAGYEDVNDAERLSRDPAMRWVVGDRGITGFTASASQMGRFETKWLSRAENLAALADLPGQWIDKVHSATRRRPSCSIRIRTRARPTASRKAALTMGTSAAPATTRCLCSTNSAMSSAAPAAGQRAQRRRVARGVGAGH
jgi:Transposase DDE domain group 1